MDKYTEKIQNQLLGLNDSQREYWKNIRQPYAVIMELTPRCNMNCVHCYLQNSHKCEELSYQHIVDILDILCNKGILFITFTGGGILTRKDFIDIYMYAKKKGFLIELFTNGYLFTNEIISFLKEYPPLLVDVSLYGSCEETYKKITGISGAFEIVLDNCKKLTSIGGRVALKSPIMTFTYQEIPKMKEIATNLHVPIRFNFEILSTIDKNNNTKEYQIPVANIFQYEVEDYNSQIKKHSGFNYPRNHNKIFNCNVGLNSFVIDYEGNMCPCMKFRHRGKSLNKQNFDDIWKDFEKYSHLQATPNFWCNQCEASGYCDICPAECEFLYGDMEYRTKKMCNLAKAKKVFYEEKSLEKAVSLLINNYKEVKI